MLYLGNPSSEAIAEAMTRGWLGCMDTAARWGKRPAGVVWAADNGCYSARWDVDAWWEWLTHEDQLADQGRCLFAVAPDVVGDAQATRARSQDWLRPMWEWGYRVAYVAQDGAHPGAVPWSHMDALFVGGSTAWKLGPEARAVVRTARAYGKWVHMGRVNSLRRYEYARAIGCDSVDGTYLAFGPDINLRRLQGWLGMADQPGLFVVGDL